MQNSEKVDLVGKAITCKRCLKPGRKVYWKDLREILSNGPRSCRLQRTTGYSGASQNCHEYWKSAIIRCVGYQDIVRSVDPGKNVRKTMENSYTAHHSAHALLSRALTYTLSCVHPPYSFWWATYCVIAQNTGLGWIFSTVLIQVFLLECYHFALTIPHHSLTFGNPNSYGGTFVWELARKPDPTVQFSRSRPKRPQFPVWFFCEGLLVSPKWAWCAIVITVWRGILSRNLLTPIKLPQRSPGKCVEYLLEENRKIVWITRMWDSKPVFQQGQTSTVSPTKNNQKLRKQYKIKCLTIRGMNSEF